MQRRGLVVDTRSHKEELAVALGAGDGRCADVMGNEPMGGHVVEALVQHADMDGGVPHDTALTDIGGCGLELRFDQRHEGRTWTQHIDDGGEDGPDARERDIAYGKVERGGVTEARKVDDVRPLEQGDPWIVAKRPVELGTADVDGHDMVRTALQQAVREPAGGTADIEAGTAAWIHPEGIECTGEFEPPAADVGNTPFDVQRDHAELIIGVSRLLIRGGRAIFSPA